MLIDSHAHLGMPEFDRNRDEVIRRAIDSGVDLIFTVGTDIGDCRKAIEIAKGNERVFAIIGIHPHNAKEVDEGTYPDLRALSREGKVKAIGEIGLDLFRNLSPRDVQMDLLSKPCYLNIPWR